MDITLPNGVSRIIKTLNHHGFEAYLVGGSIRDLLIDRKPNDYDIATAATPQEVIDIFDKTLWNIRNRSVYRKICTLSLKKLMRSDD